MENTKKNIMKNIIAVTAATLILSTSLLLTGCGEDTTATPDQAQATQTTGATINKNETTATENSSTEVVKGTTPTTDQTETTTSEKATEAKASGSSSSSVSKSDSSSSFSKSSGSSGSSSSKPSNSTSSSSASSKPSSGGGSSSKSSSSSSSSESDPHAGKTYQEAVYENVWVVDQAAYSYEEPVYETRVYTICHVCGTEFDTSYDSSAFWAHNEAHALAGEGSGYHNEVREIQIGTKTVNVPEEGHYEKRLVKEAGWY